MIKNAFAMRSNLGDPGVCGVGQQPGSGLCFQDMENLTSAMLSPGYADSLKYATHRSSELLACATQCLAALTGWPAFYCLSDKSASTVRIVQPTPKMCAEVVH